jgi:TonB family protein
MRSVFKVALAGLIGLGLTAAAPPPGFTPPKWLHKPRWEELAALWPRKALDQGIGGKATIHCKVSTVGSLFDCKVVDEFPKDAGFGSAAIALTPQFQLTPALQDGVPVTFDGVTLPLEWAKPEATGTHRNGKGYFAEKTRPVWSNPPWRATPTLAEVAAAYPAKARAAGITGRALLHCQFNESASPTACDTVFEEPKDAGFGSAARRLAERFKAPPAFRDGMPIHQGDVEIPFIFSPDQLAAEPAVQRPDWAHLPEAADLANLFPAKARAAGLKMGRAAMSCVVGPAGALEGCAVQSEDPVGMGFGEAVRGLRTSFQVKTWTVDGRPTVGGRVRVPMRFEDDQAPATKP